MPLPVGPATYKEAEAKEAAAHELRTEYWYDRGYLPCPTQPCPILIPIGCGRMFCRDHERLARAWLKLP